MRTSHIQTVEQTIAHIRDRSDEVAALFYQTLFTIDPSLRPLFRGDLVAQGRKLMQSLALVVAGLRAPERVVPALRALGRRHVAYGVADHQYATVGAALLQTLETGLGDAFTAEAREAWSAAYDFVATQMIDGATDEAFTGEKADAA